MRLPVSPSRLLGEVEAGTLRLLRRVDPSVLSLLARRPVNDVAAVVVAGVLRARFQPQRARDVDATVELRLPHRSGRGHASVSARIAGERCTVLPRASDDPDVVLTARVDHLLQLVTGQADARAMLADRRLRVTGDVLLFMRFPGMFGGLG